MLFFSDGEHIDSREARFFGSATQVKPCRAGLRTGCYPPLYPALKVSTLLFLISLFRLSVLPCLILNIF